MPRARALARSGGPSPACQCVRIWPGSRGRARARAEISNILYRMDSVILPAGDSRSAAAKRVDAIMRHLLVFWPGLRVTVRGSADSESDPAGNTGTATVALPRKCQSLAGLPERL